MKPPDDPDAGLETDAEKLLSDWPLTEPDDDRFEAMATRVQERVSAKSSDENELEVLSAPLPKDETDGEAEPEGDEDPQQSVRRSQARVKRQAGGLAALARAKAEEGKDTESLEIFAASLGLAARVRREAPALREVQKPLERAREVAAVSTPAVARGSDGAAASVQHTSNAEPTVGAGSAGAVESSKKQGANSWGMVVGVVGIAAACIMYVAMSRTDNEPRAALESIEPVVVASAGEEPSAPEAKRALRTDLATETPEDEPMTLALRDVPTEDTQGPDAKVSGARRQGSPMRKLALPAAPEQATPATAPAIPSASATGPSEPEMRMADGQAALKDKPSTGAVQAAIGSVMGAARACLAGHNEQMRATVTFASDGSVRGVDVAGGSAGTSRTGCVSTALGKARVEPFARDSYTVSLSVRPQ